tara:strand:+ start:23499 stop:24284 length:786 start_codon:yes stop_codon:yes gene_type:complete
MKHKFLLGLIVLFSCFACVPVKRLRYLQNDEGSSDVYINRKIEYRIQKHDILNIEISSQENESSRTFNMNSELRLPAVSDGNLLFYLTGQVVDDSGFITLPVIGNILVENNTTAAIKEVIEKKLSDYFIDGSIQVKVQLAGLTFTIVGEANRPGRYTIYQEKVNIFEALALAGDITIVGDRKEVILVRHSGDEIKLITLDLTSSKLLEDPNYYIMPFDIINVKPLKQKSLGLGTTGAQTLLQLASILASVATLFIAINTLR